MGLHSTLIFYRPRTPPVISGPQLADFILRFLDLGVVRHGCRQSFDIKFGERIDQDDVMPFSIVPTAVENVGLLEDIDWDVQRSRAPLSELLALLSQSPSNIYRAFIMLGPPIECISLALQRVGSPENAEDFIPDCWCLQIGPIESGRDGEFIIGWIAVGLGGNGYLHPWTIQQMLQRIDRCEELSRVEAMCRATWPVAREPVTTEIRLARRSMGSYWPYDPGRPWDWAWGLQGLL